MLPETKKPLSGRNIEDNKLFISNSIIYTPKTE